MDESMDTNLPHSTLQTDLAETSNSIDMESHQPSLLDLPDEVIQYILRLLPPYDDLKSCMQVCKRLHDNAKYVMISTEATLNKALINFNVEWKHLPPASDTSTITRRYSHSACIYDNSMYVFGGCTFSYTTFNDLWRFDLSTRKWNRLLTSGVYPSPKACATLVSYKSSLILFGGLTQPSPYPLHQSWKVFNELHVYNIYTNKWSNIVNSNRPCPPPLAGHSATVHGNKMIIFGGTLEHNVNSNDVWCLNLDTFTWHKQKTNENKPSPRYASSQIYIDETHILILGGCGGSNKVYTDAWLLTMPDNDESSNIFDWKSIHIHNKECAAPFIFCHPAIRINDNYVVTISQNPNTVKTMSGKCMKHFNRQINISELIGIQRRNQNNNNYNNSGSGSSSANSRDIHINGRRGDLLASKRQLSNDSSNNNNECKKINSDLLNLQTSSSSLQSNVSSLSNSSLPSTSSSQQSVSSTLPSTSSQNISSTLQSTSSQSVSSSSPSTSSQNVSSTSTSSQSVSSTSPQNVSSTLPSRSSSSPSSPSSSLSSSSSSPSSSLSSYSLSINDRNNRMIAFRSPNYNSHNNLQREKQLEILKRMELKFENIRKTNTVNSSSSNNDESNQIQNKNILIKKYYTSTAFNKINKSTMAIFVLDISKVLNEIDPYVKWKTIKNVPSNSPKSNILYSLVLGRGELIMFGGICKDDNNFNVNNYNENEYVDEYNSVSNNVHFITVPTVII